MVKEVLMITTAATLVVLSERTAQDQSARPAKAGRGPRHPLARLRALFAGFPRATGPLNVSSAGVDPRPARSS
jgi:hypothetical protein